MTPDSCIDDKPVWMPDHNCVLDFDQLARIGGKIIGILREQPWARPDPYTQWAETTKIVDLTKMLWHHFQQTRTTHAARDVDDHKKLLEKMADLLAKVYTIHNCITISPQGIRREVIDDSQRMVQQMAVVVKLELDRVTERMEEFIKKFQVNRSPESKDKADGRLLESSWEENPTHSGMTPWGERTAADYHTHWCFQVRHDEISDNDGADKRSPTQVAGAYNAMELDIESEEKGGSQPKPLASPSTQMNKKHIPVTS